MNGWVKVYHYLGSTRFLVAVLALCVAVVCFNLFTQSAVVPGTFALCIEGKNGTHLVSMEGWESPLKWSVNDPIFSIGALQGALLKGVSNSKQRLRCCHENQLHLSAYDNRDFFQQIDFSENSEPREIVLGREKWQASAIKGGYVSEHVLDLIAKQRSAQTPVLSLIQDENLVEYLVLVGLDGAVIVSSLESLLKTSLALFDAGENGYGVEVKIPPNLGEGSIYFRVWPFIEELEPVASGGENIPSVHLCFSEEGRSEIVTLTYDPTASGLMWPLFDGKYRVRFQPMTD